MSWGGKQYILKGCWPGINDWTTGQCCKLAEGQSKQGTYPDDHLFLAPCHPDCSFLFPFLPCMHWRKKFPQSRSPPGPAPTPPLAQPRPRPPRGQRRKPRPRAAPPLRSLSKGALFPFFASLLHQNMPALPREMTTVVLRES